MNTPTTIYDDVVLVAASEQRQGVTKTDLNSSAVTYLAFEAVVSNLQSDGGGGYTLDSNLGTGKYIRIFWAFSSVVWDVEADNVPAILSPSAEFLDVKLSNNEGEIRAHMSEMTVKKARYLYTWYSHDTYEAPVLLTFNVIA